MSQTMRELQGKVACITGASRGIGAAVAKDFAERGADLFITWTPSPNSVECASAVIAAIKASSPSTRVHGVAVDFTEPSAARTVLEAFRTHYEHIDILVNNAGTAQLSPLATTTMEDYDHLLNLNLRGPFFLTQAFLPLIRAPARIINMSSIVARLGFAYGPVYAASKAGLEAFTRCWAKDLGKDGTTVNAVAPGIIKTDLTDRLFGDEVMAEDAATVPVQQRVGEVRDVVGIVAWLASDQSRWVSGQVINASGGMVMT